MKIFKDCDEAEFKRFAKMLGVDDKDGSKRYITIWSWKGILKWIVVILVIPLFVVTEIICSINKKIIDILDEALGEITQPIKIIRLVKKKK